MNEDRTKTLDRRFAAQARMLDENGEHVPVIEGLAARYESQTELCSWTEYGVHYVVRELICRGAFDACDMSDVIFNYNHEGRVFARTRNETLMLHTDNDGLHMRAVMRPDDIEHMRLHADIEHCYICGMSFRFHVAEEERLVSESAGEVEICYRIKRIDLLHDVSAVDIPAYRDTEIQARRQDAESAINQIRRAEHNRDMERARVLALL